MMPSRLRSTMTQFASIIILQLAKAGIKRPKTASQSTAQHRPIEANVCPGTYGPAGTRVSGSASRLPASHNRTRGGATPQAILTSSGWRGVRELPEERTADVNAVRGTAVDRRLVHSQTLPWSYSQPTFSAWNYFPPPSVLNIVQRTKCPDHIPSLSYGLTRKAHNVYQDTSQTASSSPRSQSNAGTRFCQKCLGLDDIGSSSSLSLGSLCV